MSGQIRLRALAKINLDLRVLRRRDDGFHEIRTVFQTISLADRIDIRFEPASSVSIAVDGNVEIADNLIARAARLVFAELGCGGNVRLRLTKRIPMGAGLGGGSSDAAAVLLGLPPLLGRTILPERLQELALQLGSDVPFFLLGGTALGLGKGEELYPLPDFPKTAGLLVAPEVHVSTAAAYNALSPRLTEDEALRKQAGSVRFVRSQAPQAGENDFEAVVFEQHPQLKECKNLLVRAGAVSARMTGSGSALFGFFESAESRTEAQKALSEWRTFPFSLVSRKRYEQMWRKQSRQRERETGTFKVTDPDA